MSEGDAKPMASLHPPKQEIIYDYWNDHPLLPTDSNDSKQRITHIPSPSASGICRPGRFSATFYSIVPDIMNHQSVRNEPGSDPEIFGLNVDSKAIFTSAVSDALTSSMVP